MTYTLLPRHKLFNGFRIHKTAITPEISNHGRKDAHLNQNNHVSLQTDASYLQRNFLGKLFICTPEPKQSCVAPNRCKLSTKELPGEALHLHTCVRCSNNYPWLNDPTGDGFF